MLSKFVLSTIMLLSLLVFGASSKEVPAERSSYKGVIVDLLTRKPLPGVFVNFHHGRVKGKEYFYNDTSLTDSSGSFMFNNIVPITQRGLGYHLRCYKKGYKNYIISRPINIPPNDTVEIAVSMVKELSLKIGIKDDTGKPVDSVAVSLYSKAHKRVIRVGYSNNLGVVVFDKIDSDSLVVYASKDPYLPISKSLFTGSVDTSEVSLNFLSSSVSTPKKVVNLNLFNSRGKIHYEVIKPVISYYHSLDTFRIWMDRVGDSSYNCTIIPSEVAVVSIDYPLNGIQYNGYKKYDLVSNVTNIIDTNLNFPIDWDPVMGTKSHLTKRPLNRTSEYKVFTLDGKYIGTSLKKEIPYLIKRYQFNRILIIQER